MGNIIEIAEIIKNHGGNLYLVGGAVRDELIGVEVYDRDYCVTGLSKDEFQNIFPSCRVRGKSFEVYELDGDEFAMARRELKCGVGHNDFSIQCGKKITIEEDLRRRDITINSIAKEVLTGAIIDPYDGIGDIKNKRIRATSEAFSDDPLRAYRVARIACKLWKHGFKVDGATIELMKNMKSELSTLSSERVFDEFRRALTYSKPSIFFDILRQSDILDVHFLELKNLIGVEQPLQYHPEGDAYNHTMLALDWCAKNTSDIKIRFAALVHDLGKGKTPVEEYPHHIGHDIKGVEEVQNLAIRLKLPNDWTVYGKVAAKEHMKGGIFDKMTPKKQVEFIERVYKTKIGLKGMEYVVEADRNCRGDCKNKVAFAQMGEKLMKEINGRLIKEKFKIDDGEKIKLKLHEERVLTVKRWAVEQKDLEEN